MKKWLMGFVIVRFVAMVFGGFVVPFFAGFVLHWWNGTRHPISKAVGFVKRNRKAQVAVALAVVAATFEFLGGSVIDLLDRAWIATLLVFHGAVVLALSNVATIPMIVVFGTVLFLWRRRVKTRRSQEDV